MYLWMLNAKVIGIGAAGNKAVITLLEKGIIVDDKQILLLNSTLKDVPEKYKDFAIEFGDTKGCGKERNLAKNMIITAYKFNTAGINHGKFMSQPFSIKINPVACHTRYIFNNRYSLFYYGIEQGWFSNVWSSHHCH